MIELLAPAKLNLTLEVLGKRQDGYHEIRSVIKTISLFDVLKFNLSEDVKLTCDLPEWSAEKSLVSRAVSLVQKLTDCSKGVRIEVDKRIPLVSGLGGDSSDAATTLRGLNRLWGVGLTHDKLLDLAKQLGSDVPLFLCNGTALAEGRGEIITSLPPLPHMWVVLVVPIVPRVPDKTAKLYASLKDNHFTDGQITQRFIDRFRDGKDFTSLLFNTFENVAFTPSSEVGKCKSHLLKMGASDVHLAGSGPTVFTLIKGKTEAEDLYARCQGQGMEAYMVETSVEPKREILF